MPLLLSDLTFASASTSVVYMAHRFCVKTQTARLLFFSTERVRCALIIIIIIFACALLFCFVHFIVGVSVCMSFFSLVLYASLFVYKHFFFRCFSFAFLQSSLLSTAGFVASLHLPCGWRWKVGGAKSPQLNNKMLSFDTHKVYQKWWKILLWVIRW